MLLLLPIFGNLLLFECEVYKLDEKTNLAEQTGAPATEPDDIMQHIQDMIGDLLTNAVNDMHKSNVGDQLGETPADKSKNNELPAQMGLAEIKGFIDVMQKFIDNVTVMVRQLETGSSLPGETDDKFLDGYMATADTVLEIAAFSMKDKTTGLSNRYSFDNRLILEWNRATRDKTALSLVIFSVDDFDKCEDEKAHDDLIKEVSVTLETSIKRSSDFIARWSDDEFAALLPITDLDGATIVAERICAEVGTMNQNRAEKDRKSSVSIGVYVHTPEPGEKPADLINKAYEAYEKAKETEGDKVVFA